jgi:hypothetical protein
MGGYQRTSYANDFRKSLHEGNLDNYLGAIKLHGNFMENPGIPLG